MEIIIEHLTKKFGSKTALNDVSLVIRQGMFGLLGKNGAGKTTLMRSITTLLNKTDGKITVCGIPVEKAGEVRKLIGYLPQDFSVYPNMSVYKALDYLGTLSGMAKKDRVTAIGNVLRKVNLYESRNLKVKALSGGMKRRLGIAQAILHDPKVLIVDEPTAGLDPQERIRFRNLLCEISADRIVILSTHIVEDIQSTCEKLAVLDQGRLFFKGDVKELLQTAREHVFTVKVNKQEAEELKESCIITGIVGAGDEYNVRFLADKKPLPGAEACEPTIEDAYMYLINRDNPADGGKNSERIGGASYVS